MQTNYYGSSTDMCRLHSALIILTGTRASDSLCSLEVCIVMYEFLTELILRRSFSHPAATFAFGFREETHRV